MSEYYDNIDLNNEVSASIRNIRYFYKNKVKLEVVNVSKLSEFKVTIFQQTHPFNNWLFLISLPPGYPKVPINIRPIQFSDAMKQKFSSRMMRFYTINDLIEGLIKFCHRFDFDSLITSNTTSLKSNASNERFWLTTKSNVPIYRTTQSNSARHKYHNKKRISRKCQTYQLKQDNDYNYILKRMLDLKKENAEFRNAMQLKTKVKKRVNTGSRLKSPLHSMDKINNIKKSKSRNRKTTVKTGSVCHIVYSELKSDYENTIECFILQTNHKKSKFLIDKLLYNKDIVSTLRDHYLQISENLKIGETNDLSPQLNVSRESLEHLLFDKGVGILQVSQASKRLFETMTQDAYSKHLNFHLTPFNEVHIWSRMLWNEFGVSSTFEIDNSIRHKAKNFESLPIQTYKIDPKSLNVTQKMILTNEPEGHCCSSKDRKPNDPESMGDKKVPLFDSVKGNAVKNQMEFTKLYRNINVKDKITQVTALQCMKLAKYNMELVSITDNSHQNLSLKSNDDEFDCFANENSTPRICMLSNLEECESSEEPVDSSLLLDDSDENVNSEKLVNIKSVHASTTTSDDSLTSAYTTKPIRIVTLSKDDFIYQMCERLSQPPTCLDSNLLEEIEYTIELNTENSDEVSILKYLNINVNCDESENLIEFYTSTYNWNLLIFVKDISVRFKRGKEAFVRLHKIRKKSIIHRMFSVENRYYSNLIDLNKQIYFHGEQVANLWPINYAPYFYSSLQLSLEYKHTKEYLQNYLNLSNISIHKTVLYKSAFEIFERISETFKIETSNHAFRKN